MDDTEKGTWTAVCSPKIMIIPSPKWSSRLVEIAGNRFEMELTKTDLDEAHRLGLKVVVWVGPKRKRAWSLTMRRLKN